MKMLRDLLEFSQGDDPFNDDSGDSGGYNPHRTPAHNQLFKMLDALMQTTVHVDGQRTTFANWANQFDALPYEEQEKVIHGELGNMIRHIVQQQTGHALPPLPPASRNTVKLVVAVLSNIHIINAVRKIDSFLDKIPEEQLDNFYDYLVRGEDGYFGTKEDPHQYGTVANIVQGLRNFLDKQIIR